jgi:hypothetical protein
MLPEVPDLRHFRQRSGIPSLDTADACQYVFTESGPLADSEERGREGEVTMSKTFLHARASGWPTLSGAGVLAHPQG